MNILQRWMIGAVVAVAAVALPLGATHAVADQVVSGELVMLKDNANRFRIVEHAGTFTAPAGTPLDSLDGRPVEVVLGSNGRVRSITEMPVAIDPVVSGWETVRGQLQVRDGLVRTFTFAGDDRVYVAPAGVDIAAYAGRWVEARLDTSGRVTQLRAASAPQGAVVPAAPTCAYRGEAYGEGASVCQAGMQFRCEGRAWRNLGTACGAAPVSERSCMFGGATVASGSSICRDGATLRCSDGQWLSTQIACR